MGLKNKAKHAVKKAAKAVVKKLNNKTLNRMVEVYKERNRNYDKVVVDVCFINGCDAMVPHPPRYRVTHQRQQLEANGLTTSEIFYTNVVANDVVVNASCFVIFRCPYTPEIYKLITLAHALHKKVYFDIDDLVIDTVYTDLIPYVQGLSPAEKKVYDDGVIRMGKTLKLCDGAITTTKALADELSKYVPEVFINRNTASEEMYRDSCAALVLKEKNFSEDVTFTYMAGKKKKSVTIKKRTEGEFRIGYFSGSITHNADVALILPSIISFMKAHENVYLYLVGELTLPEEILPFKDRVVTFPFLDWHKLPILISMVDVNLAPLEDTIFNNAKSENKWVEAALVNTVTVASNVGAFAEMVEDKKTGFLCDSAEDWSDTFEMLYQDRELCKRTAKEANSYVKEHCLTIYSGNKLADFFRERKGKTAALILPSTEISGGIMVALRHLKYLFEEGYQTTIIASNPTLSWMMFEGEDFPVIYMEGVPVTAHFDIAIGTMWTTVDYLNAHPRFEKKFYLVQNFETDFYEAGNPLRPLANKTYSNDTDIIFATISKWCKGWLFEKYHKDALFVPNGIEMRNFTEHQRTFEDGKKVRILIEGDSAVSYKGVDESFKITNSLDRDKYEIWYMSYNAAPKEWYHVDKFLHRVPYDKVSEVYNSCDILLKSSTLESFSYPPLEMMATGGFVVLVQNGGNSEYIRDHENCLAYQTGDFSGAVKCIEEIISDRSLQEKFYANGLSLAHSRDWKLIKNEIISLYERN